MTNDNQLPTDKSGDYWAWRRKTSKPKPKPQKDDKKK